MWLAAKRLEHTSRVRIISDDTLYAPNEGIAEQINVVGRIRRFGRGGSGTGTFS